MHLIPDQEKVPEQVLDLYIDAFPFNERGPKDMLCTDRNESRELLDFYDGETFCGFALLLGWRDIVHILYFAVPESLRGHGYGSQILHSLCKKTEGKRLIADLEEPLPEASNYDERLAREHFYLSNGFVSTEVSYEWRQERYCILSYGGTVDAREFDAFWSHFHVRRERRYL